MLKTSTKWGLSGKKIGIHSSKFSDEGGKGVRTILYQATKRPRGTKAHLKGKAGWVEA